MENFETKGRSGEWYYGYIRRKGLRNLWVVRCPKGNFYAATDNNLSAAINDAGRYREFGM